MTIYFSVVENSFIILIQAYKSANSVYTGFYRYNVRHILGFDSIEFLMLLDTYLILYLKLKMRYCNITLIFPYHFDHVSVPLQGISLTEIKDLL